ncbi:MAG: histidine kinase, partial [Bacteroidota bacterium]
YKELGMMDKSALHYEKALEMKKYIMSAEKKVKILNNLGAFAIEKGDYDLAEKYLSDGREIAVKIGNLHEQKYNWLFQYELDTLRKQYRSANHSLLQYYAVRDSIEGLEMSKKIAELQTKFETEQKDNEIEMLSQNNEIQTLKITQQRFLLAGLLLVLVLSAFVLYLFYQRKRSIADRNMAKLEHKLLRSQMNPHFIFNSLGMVQNYMLENNVEKASKYLSKFGKLMRQILEHSRDEYISIVAEVSTLHNYLELQRSRFPAIEFDIKVDDSIEEDTMIPPMFAQPFIENAFEHGFSSPESEGKVTVSFTRKGDFILLQVNDNGVGVSEQKSKQHRSLATRITRERLQLYQRKFKEKLDLVIKPAMDRSEEGRGTLVQLMIPFKFE